MAEFKPYQKRLPGSDLNKFDAGHLLLTRKGKFFKAKEHIFHNYCGQLLIHKGQHIPITKRCEGCGRIINIAVNKDNTLTLTWIN